MTIGLLNCDYDINPNAYRGFVLKYEHDGLVQERFDTGEPVVDYQAAGLRAKQLVDLGILVLVMQSSSVDHFVHDNKEYGWRTDDDGNEFITKLEAI